MCDQCSPQTCDECGAPARGQVPTSSDGVPAHYCRQCAAHCQMTAYLRRQGTATG